MRYEQVPGFTRLHSQTRMNLDHDCHNGRAPFRNWDVNPAYRYIIRTQPTEDTFIRCIRIVRKRLRKRMSLHPAVKYAIVVLLILLSTDAVPEHNGRMVTQEELALHDGIQTKDMWLSIMSQVYDVTRGPEYYAVGGPYRVFVGRDGNVPFVTGAFNPDEAQKPLTDLTPHQVMSLETWAEFYEKEEKYPFIGLLEGSLYDENGDHTEMMGKVQEMIGVARKEAEARKKRTAEIIEKRKRDDALKKKNMEKPKAKAKPTKPVKKKSDEL
jgi:hypothetical protein